MLSSVATDPPKNDDAEDIATIMQALQGKVESITITTKVGDAERSVMVKAKK